MEESDLVGHLQVCEGHFIEVIVALHEEISIYCNYLLPRCLLSTVLHKVILTFILADCQKLFLVRKRRAVLGVC